MGDAKARWVRPRKYLVGCGADAATPRAVDEGDKKEERRGLQRGLEDVVVWRVKVGVVAGRISSRAEGHDSEARSPTFPRHGPPSQPRGRNESSQGLCFFVCGACFFFFLSFLCVLVFALDLSRFVS